MSRRTRRILWLLVGLVLLGWVVHRAGPLTAAKAVGEAFSRPRPLAAAVALFIVTQTGFLLKWHLMSRQAGAAVTFRQSLRLFGTLCLVGTFTPGRAGELVVPLLMRGGGQLTGVALVNRILESMWTVCAAMLAVWLLFHGDPHGGRLWILALVLAIFIGAAVILSRRRLTAGVFRLLRRSLEPFARFRPVRRLLGLEGKYAGGIEQFYAANERLLRAGPILGISALMIFIWIMMVSANYLLIAAVVPTVVEEITFVTVFAVMVVSAAAMFLSPIPGGVGLSEFTAVALFAYLGYPQPEFVSFLLLSRLILYTVVITLYLVGQLAGRELSQPGPVGARTGG